MRKKELEAAVKTLFDEREGAEIQSLKSEIAEQKKQIGDLLKAMNKARSLWFSSYSPPKATTKKRKNPSKYNTRVTFGDLHGIDQDEDAVSALLHDIEKLNPDQIVLLGDMINCSGTFSKYHRVHVSEYSYKYSDDVAACNNFLDRVQAIAPNAEIFYVEGNHELRVDKWAAASFSDRDLALQAIDTFGAKTALFCDKRGIHYFKANECHMGLHKPGIIRLGKCGFMHGVGSGKYVSYKNLVSVGMNIIHGHNHTEQSITIRTARDPALRGACPGCLCILQQYYNHEKPTNHTHGYTLQFIDKKTDWFSSNNIAIINGQSLLNFARIK